MAYQSLYRRYRPGRFSEIAGQEHVVAALRNAIRDGRAGHAYLFSGPRGTGKTSTARIMAKALNCTDLSDDGEPCGRCDSCEAFAAGTSYDLHELDAASNNGVEAVRDLIAKVALGSPGRTKVYILDEVHMLTSGAENALLKTLEEPPDHVKFVLATTEPHKVVPTIRSRTQHLRFELLPAETLTAHVRWVADDAGLDVDDDIIAHVVREGAGSVRDTLSALDQVVAAGGVHGDGDVTARIVDAVAAADSGEAMIAVEAALRSGRDPRVIGESVLGRLRDAFLAKMGADLSHLPDGDRQRATDVAETAGAARITRAMETLGTALVDMRQAPDPRIDLEVALLRLTRVDLDTDPAALLERIERLERGVARGDAPVSAAGATASSASVADPAGAGSTAAADPAAAGGAPAPSPGSAAARAPSDGAGPAGTSGSAVPAAEAAASAGAPSAAPASEGATASDGRESPADAARRTLASKRASHPGAASSKPSLGALRGSARPAGADAAPTAAAAPVADAPAAADAAPVADAAPGADGPAAVDATSAADAPAGADAPADPPVAASAPGRADAPSTGPDAPAATASTAGTEADVAEPAPPESSSDPSGEPGEGAGPSPGPAASSPERPPEPEAAPSASAPPAEPTGADLAAIWESIVLPGVSKRARARFQGGRFLDSTAVPTFALPNAIHRDRCREVRPEVDAVLERHFGGPVRFELAVDDPAAADSGSGNGGRTNPSDRSDDADDEIEITDVADLVDADAGPGNELDRLTQVFPGAEVVESDPG